MVCYPSYTYFGHMFQNSAASLHRELIFLQVDKFGISRWYCFDFTMLLKEIEAVWLWVCS